MAEGKYLGLDEFGAITLSQGNGEQVVNGSDKQENWSASSLWGGAWTGISIMSNNARKGQSAKKSTQQGWENRIWGGWRPRRTGKLGAERWAFVWISW